MNHDLCLGVSRQSTQAARQTQLPFVGTAMLPARLLARLPSLILGSNVMGVWNQNWSCACQTLRTGWKRDGKNPRIVGWKESVQAEISRATLGNGLGSGPTAVAKKTRLIAFHVLGYIWAAMGPDALS